MNFGLDRFTIRTRIFAGFGMLILLGVLVAGLGSWQLASVAAELQRITGIADNAKRLIQIQKDVEVMRRAALRAKVDGDPDSVREFHAAAADGASLLKQIAALNTSEERRRIYSSVGADIDALNTKLDQMVELTKQTSDDQHKLGPISADLFKATTEAIEIARRDGDPKFLDGAHNVEAAILKMRSNALLYLVTHDPANMQDIQNSIADAQQVIARAQQNAPDNLLAPLQRAGADMKAYNDQYAAVLPNFQKVEDSYWKDMVPQVNGAQKELDDARESLGGDETAIRNEANDTIAGTKEMQVVLAGIALLIGAALAFAVGRSISGPLSRMAEAMRRLAGGDHGIEIPARDGRDEIAEMARAVDVFKQNMIETGRLQAEQQAEQAKKEARQTAVDGYIREFETSVGEVVGMVTSAATELETTAQSMSATAEETQRQSTAVAAASEQASSNVQTVAAATEELSSSISEIGRQVTESARITAQAVQETERTNAQIQGLADAAQRIGDVVKLINDIASQTNLLALNATIEAARAGEAGKGFAVVASEVKSLAGQTAKATEEISAKIAEMQAATSLSVDAVKTIGETIGHINEIATTIASAVEEQGAATQEIARNVQQASAGTGEVSSNIVGVTKAASETGAASNQVLNAAAELSKQSVSLRQQVDGFLAKIRTA